MGLGCSAAEPDQLSKGKMMRRDRDENREEAQLVQKTGKHRDVVVPQDRP